MALQREQNSRATGEYFNVFKLCKVNHYENAHSDIIAEFLDPKGTHGCGNKFLQAFFKITELDYSKYEHADITREHKITTGRPDILIQSEKHVIIIENKIYADEGKNQLNRYRNWLDNNSGDGKNAPLLFLTLDGRESNCEGKYTPLSYRDHIVPWLCECIRIAVEKPFVRESLIQYKKLIEELVKGRIMESEKDVAKVILSQGQKGENFMQAAIAVARSLNFAKAQWFFDNIVLPLKKHNITADISEDGGCEALIRSYGLDCRFSRSEGDTEVIYLYDNWNFRTPLRRIITYSDNTREKIKTKTDSACDDLAIGDDFWGVPERAKKYVKAISDDVDKIFNPNKQK